MGFRRGFSPFIPFAVPALIYEKVSSLDARLLIRVLLTVSLKHWSPNWLLSSYPEYIKGTVVDTICEQVFPNFSTRLNTIYHSVVVLIVSMSRGGLLHHPRS